MPRANDTRKIKVIPYGNVDAPRSAYEVTRERADMMILRGQAKWANDGTRTLYECKVSARGSLRTWRKVTNRSKSGASLYSSMQLVPGVSQGRNTGGRKPQHVGG